MTCQKCGTPRILSCQGKCSDMFDATYHGSSGKEYQGYVAQLDILGGGGDYLEFKVCLDCGQMQGKFPVTDAELREANLIEQEEEDVR